MFYKVSYNQGFCSLLGLGTVLKKKSQYLADRAGYCDFAFCYMCLFDTLFYRFQYVVENLIGVAEGDEIALKLRWTYVDATVQHVAEIAGETFLVALLRILEVAHRLVVEEHREHRAYVVHLDTLAFYYLLKAGEEAVAALFEEFVNTRFAQLLQGTVVEEYLKNLAVLHWGEGDLRLHEVHRTHYASEILLYIRGYGCFARRFIL